MKQAICRLVVLTLAVLAARPVWPADLTDEQVKAAERLLTGGSDRPISVEQVTPDFLTKLYGLPNALAAMRKVLRGKDFAELNDRIGTVRHEANLDIWRQIIRETGVPIELNRAGKKNGALSDLDNFFFASITSIPGQPGLRPDQVHGWLRQRHEELWRVRFGDLPPKAFDVMHFPGDTFMKDWRMNLGSWAEHLASLDTSISVLSGTDGAYFLPGAYKVQVYRRYIAEGETTLLTPSATDPSGVKTTAGKTRDLSATYRRVPFEIDPHGQLENALQNVYEADRVSDPIKHAKYEIRISEGQAAAFTNLEVDLRTLILGGRETAFNGAVEKMFERFSDPQAMPGVLGDMTEVGRVVKVLNRIELDKIIGALGSRPRPEFWSETWRNYRPTETFDTEAKLEYFANEVEHVRKARRLSDADFAASRARVAADAEALFHQKAAEVAKMAVIAAAERTFREVFTEEGFARQRHLHGETAALRQVAERVRGLHASLAVIDDPSILRAVVDAAPPEVRGAVSLIGEIASIQRDTVARRGKIEARELRESDEALQRIMRQLGATPATARNRSVVSFDETSKNARWTSYDEILRRDRRRNPQAESSGNLAILPDSLGEIGSGMAEELFGLGGADSALQMYAAWLRGDTESALAIFRDAVIEAVPSWGSAYSVAKSLREARDSGEVWPIVQFAANIGAGASLGPLYGAAMAMYGIANTAFAIDWHFYGQPTQEDALSYILMGDLSASRGSADSRFPAIADRRNLKETALLLTHVTLPRLSTEQRGQILRAHFLAQANREAGQENRTPGSASWLNARDRAFEALDRDSEYWLRRVFFYQSVHIRFFDWVRSVTSDADWQRIDRNPPSVIAELAQSDRLQEYPDAFTPLTGGGGYWDHERVWLRRYFDGWMAEYARQWRQANLDRGEFMGALAGQAPGWERAVVDQLIGLYLEGEMLDLSMEQLINLRGPGEAAKQKRARESAQAGLASARRRLSQDLEPARKAYFELANRIDNALWSEEIAENLLAALTRSLPTQRPYRPVEPSLSLRIPDPVSAFREDLPIETTVNGDPVQLPDDLATSISFRPTGRWIGQRPPGVLRWDVDAHLGADVPDDKVVVVGADAEVVVTSASDPRFRLLASAPVFFLERLDRQTDQSGRPLHKVRVAWGSGR